MRNKTVRYISAMALAVLLSHHASAGILSISGSATDGKDDPGAVLSGSAGEPQYLPISKYYAGSGGGVTLTGSGAPDVGYVSGTGYQWFLPTGLSGAVDDNPIVITCGTDAYGNANPVGCGLTHIGSSGSDEVCTSNTSAVLRVSINVVKPILTFKTAGGWDSDNTAISRLDHDFSFTFSIQTFAQYTDPGSGDTYAGCPYEYDYTLQPDNSGAGSSDMLIYETASTHYSLKDSEGTAFDSWDDAPTSATYGNEGYYCYTSPTPPANPKMFACDVPGVDEKTIQAIMKSTEAQEAIITITLTSYPLFQDPHHQHLDSGTMKTHTFYIWVDSTDPNGNGPYNWNCSY